VGASRHFSGTQRYLAMAWRRRQAKNWSYRAKKQQKLQTNLKIEFSTKTVFS
jgi:hypothetical protein